MGNIGDNIRKLRIERGMSQEQLADRIGKTRSAVSQYEHGTTMPRMGVIESMAQVFGVPKHEIIGDTYEYAVVNFVMLEERELLEMYRSLDEHGRSVLMATARALSGK